MDKVKLPVTEHLPPQKDLTSLLKEKKNLLRTVFGILLFIFVLAVVGIASWFILKSNKGVTNNSTLTQNQTQTQNTSTQTNVRVSPPPEPLLPGPHIFSASSKSNTGISIKEFYVSSLTTEIGDPQTFRLTMTDSKSSVNQISVNLITDTKSQNYALTLKSGTGADGVWEGTWKTNDTHDYIYKAKIIIKDSSGNKLSVTPAFR